MPINFQQISDRLDRAYLRGQKARHLLTHLYEYNQLRQQEIRQDEAHIDQLLAELKESHQLSADQILSGRHYLPLTYQTQEEVIEQLQLQIRQRNELLRQSMHDLKSTFNVIRWATDILNQTPNDAHRQQMLAMLQRNVQQATQLVTELLDITRLEVGHEQRKLTRFDVAELLSNLTETIRPMATERGLWLRTQGTTRLKVESDAVKLHRIAQNLLLNAVKYTRMGGVTLAWTTQPNRQQWRLTVTDTGPGLSASDRTMSGEGIGLLIVKQLCALLEGQFWIEEPKSGGTQFSLSFPRRYLK